MVYDQHGLWQADFWSIARRALTVTGPSCGRGAVKFAEVQSNFKLAILTAAEELERRAVLYSFLAARSAEEP